MPLDECRTSPERVREAVPGAIEGGAEGVILSRTYSETQLANAAGAGDVFREPG
jgi:hypothetical protein